MGVHMRVLCWMAFAVAAPLFAQPYDIVLANGRVMDPESNLDAVRDVGIRGGKIAAISGSALEGRSVVDVRGLVVTAGFIDLHSHGQTPENYRFKARDGVTTALELEVGAGPIDAWYRERAGHSVINFGASSGDIPARMAVMHDSGTFLPRDNAVNRAATPAEQQQIRERIRAGLTQGALGIGLGIAYAPHMSEGEVLELFKLAAAQKAVIYVHMRNSGPEKPGAIESVQEMLRDAAATKALVHIVHITSTGL